MLLSLVRDRMKTPKTIGKDEKYNPDDGMIQPADGGNGFCVLVLAITTLFIVMLILSASL
jgi:hypothetical protein